MNRPVTDNQSSSSVVTESSWIQLRQSGVLAFLERCLAVFGLLLISPLLLLLGLLVRLTSRGPALFKQTRIGRHGKSFLLVKFRSMTVDAEKESGPVWAKAYDNRTTIIGGFLRRSHLDELPQLWNIVRGDMSFIGPRPERPFFVSQLSAVDERYAKRHLVKPGVTGLAQVSFDSEATVENSLTKLRYDLEYIENGTLFMDLKILLMTIPTAFR